MRGQLFDEPKVRGLSEKYGKTPAQIILRWDLEHRVVTIPKSIHPERIRDNAQVFDFELSDDDMEAINNMNEEKRICGHPDHFF